MLKMMRGHMRIILIALMSLVPGSALADEVKLGSFTLELPDDLEVIEGEEFEGETILNLMWRRETVASDLAELEAEMDPDEFEMTVEELLAGNTGNVLIIDVPLDHDQFDLSPNALGRAFCQDFRETWGYGLGYFEESQGLAHCASALGAVNYLVCKPFDKAMICGTGMDYVALMKAETRWDKIVEPWPAFDDQGDERWFGPEQAEILSSVAEITAVDKVVSVLKSATLK